jgi:hypothetical protein
MSTAKDILERVRHCIDPQIDALPVLNEAIRSVAKRLFVLQSSLLQAELSVSVWESVSLTAEDIAFVDSDPDTITSVAEAFVTTGFEAGMHITTDETDNAGPFEIDTVAAGTLTLISTDSLTAVSAGDEITITSDASYGDLPSDFWGLVEYPYLSGESWHLLPLPNQQVKHSYDNAGIPLYYQIKGARIEITPQAGSDYTIVGDYFAKPTAITALTDTMPYYELFDDVIAEYMRTRFLTRQQPGGTSLSSIFMAEEIDRIAMVRDKKAPYHNKTGINWNDETRNF